MDFFVLYKTNKKIYFSLQEIKGFIRVRESFAEMV